jgi:hypothetical protein
MAPPFYCKKRKETMAEACADCEDCPGSGVDLVTHSRKRAMSIEDVIEVFGRRM